MINDYLQKNTLLEIAEIRALEDVSSILESLGKTINDYEFVPFGIQINEDERLRKMIVEETMNLNIEEAYACASMLNNQQKIAYDIGMVI